MSSSVFLLLAVFAGLLATSLGMIIAVWVKFGASPDSQTAERSRRFFLASLLAVGGLSLALYAVPRYQIMATEEGNFQAVISALYASQQKESGGSGGLLIWYQTINNFRVDLELESLQGRIPILEATTFNDFVSRNAGPAGLISELSIPQRHMIVTPADAIKINKQEGAFAGLAKLGWNGIFASSRPGFNAGQDQALLYVEVICGDGCGSGDLVLLSKIDGNWERIGFMPLWAS